MFVQRDEHDEAVAHPRYSPVHGSAEDTVHIRCMLDVPV